MMHISHGQNNLKIFDMYIPGLQTYFYLLIDGTRHSYASNNYASATATVTILLKESQKVQVQSDLKTSVYGHQNDALGYEYSWFTGRLLYAV